MFSIVLSSCCVLLIHYVVVVDTTSVVPIAVQLCVIHEWQTVLLTHSSIVFKLGHQVFVKPTHEVIV